MSQRNNTTDGEDELVPLGILLVSLIFGGYMLVNQPLTGDTAFVQWIFIGLSILGVLYVVVGFRGEYQRNGLQAAVEWSFGTTNRSGAHSSSAPRSKTDKTPPPSQNLKNELYFERADRKCEWCDERVNSPDIHHIKPRSDGGSNNPKNLIVLCPNCHRDADRGTISRSKLKYQVKEQISNGGD